MLSQLPRYWNANKNSSDRFSKFNLCAWSARAMRNGSVPKIDVKAAMGGR